MLMVIMLLAARVCMAEGFIENRGQWQHPFAYKATIAAGAVFLETNAITFHLTDRTLVHDAHVGKAVITPDTRIPYHAFKLKFHGSNEGVVPQGRDFGSTYFNFFLGSDPQNWQGMIYPAGRVVYENLYDGIDLHVILTDDRLKYEFHLAPGADPALIRIETEGLDSMYIDREGNLLLSTSVTEIKELKPHIYQTRGEKTIAVEGAFEVTNEFITYRVEPYDTNLPLVIDPELVFSTYCGSTADNWGYTATPDQHGFLYAGSISWGTGYPVTIGAYDASFNGTGNDVDVCITKYDTSGTLLVYSTYLGGADVDLPHSLIVDGQNNLFVFGTTGSDNFPTTSGAFDRSFNGGPLLDFSNIFSFAFEEGSDMYVAKFSASGSALLASSFVGGTGNDGINQSSDLTYNYADQVRGEINLDDNGNVYIASTSFSSNFPGTAGGFQPTKSAGQDGIIVKMNSTLSSIIWSSYLGAAGDDACYGIDIADDGSVYVTGGTSSSTFPTHAGAFQGNYLGGRCDAFITHISAAGDDILHSTYFGSTSYDQMYFIQLDRNGHPHVFGQTENPGSHFIFNAGFNDFGGGQVVANFRPDLESRVWSTQWGSTTGRPNISPTSFLVDVCNSVYLAGWGGEVNTLGNNNASDVGGLPTTNDALQNTPDPSGSDFYLCVLTADANTLTYGSFFGGGVSAEHVDGGTSRFDRSGKIYQCVCAGCGGNDDFPIEPDPGAWSATNNTFSRCNSAVFKIDFELPLVIADFDAPSFGCAPFTVTFQNNSVIQTSTSYSWSFGNGQTSTSANPTITYTQAGEYTIRLIVSDPNSCNLSDTIEKQLTIKEDTTYSLPPIDTCMGVPVQIGPDAANYDTENLDILWSPGEFLDDPQSLNPTATVTQSTLFRLVIDYGGCQERILQQVNIDIYPIAVSSDTIVCSDFAPFAVSGTAFGVAQAFEWSDDPEFQNILSTDSILQIASLPDPLNYFYFRTTKANGCQMVDTLLVTVSDRDIYLTQDTAVCRNEDAIIQAISENPNNTFAYFWTLSRYMDDPGQELLTDTTSNFIVINGIESGKFYLYARSLVVTGCSAEDSVTVQVSTLDRAVVNAYAEKDTFYYGEYVPLHGEPSEGYYHYWSPGTFLSDSLDPDPLARPKHAMTYVWTVTDKEVPECSFSDTVYVRPYEILCDEPEVYMPNAFTPNADGNNDELRLRGRNVSAVDLHIRDRWGNEVFHTTDLDRGWDGTYKGEPVDPAVYVYYFEASCIDGQRVFKKGNVTVIR